MSLPSWLSETPVIEQKPIRKTGGRSWINPAIDRLAAFKPRSNDTRSAISIDPRAALLGFISLLVCATLIEHLGVIAVAWAVSVILALSTGITFRVLLLTTAAFGLITALFLLPAATSYVTPGHVLFSLAGLKFSGAGVHTFLVVMVRTIACLNIGIGLFSSNRPERLFESLRWFRVPGFFVMILLLTYRYIFVVSQAALEVHVARKSRVPNETSLSEVRKWLGERIGALFARSRKLGEEVHLAMISRGFDGEWIPKPQKRLKSSDFGWILMCLLLISILMLVDRGMI